MIYLDNAATSSPKPACVAKAVMAALAEDNANPGRSGHELSLNAGRTVLRCREALAGLISASEPDNIAFAFNCTDALNLAIKGCLRKGAHVVSTTLEHNSVLRPLMGLKLRGDISLTLVNPRADGCVYPEDVRAALRRDTRLIAMTHASNVTGAIQHVAAVGALAREAGALFLVDGAQTLGCMPVNMLAIGCDMYAFPGHKGLLGPQGTGGLYIRKGLTLNTVREGGTGSSSESMIQPRELPERYEAGTLNYHGIAGLEAGVNYVRENLREIFMSERELTSALYAAISEIDGAQIYAPAQESARAGIVSFNIGDMESSQVADALAREGIAVRGGLHCAPGAHQFLGTLRRGAVRASVGHATTFEDIEALARALKKL